MINQYSMNKSQIAYELQKMLDMGNIVHVGWNKYAIKSDKIIYNHIYSDIANNVARIINDKFYDLKFQIFELVQLNSFVNHLFGHNVIFVYVENEFQEYVFDTLRNEYPGRVMFRPNLKEYYRYVMEDEIVILRLPTETPKGNEVFWHVRLEKMIVDIFTDKIVSKIVSDGEKENIIKGVLEDYYFDEDMMYRYAKRKGVEKKLKKELEKYEV